MAEPGKLILVPEKEEPKPKLILEPEPGEKPGRGWPAFVPGNPDWPPRNRLALEDEGDAAREGHRDEDALYGMFKDRYLDPDFTPTDEQVDQFIRLSEERGIQLHEVWSGLEQVPGILKKDLWEGPRRGVKEVWRNNMPATNTFIAPRNKVFKPFRHDEPGEDYFSQKRRTKIKKSGQWNFTPRKTTLTLPCTTPRGYTPRVH